MKINFKLAVLLVFILTVFLFAGCSQEASIEENNEITKLKIGTLPIEDMLPILVAEQKGYFAEENVEVELVHLQSALECESAIQSGQIDGLITDMIVAVLLKDSGLDSKMTSCTLGASSEEGRFAVIASKESGINEMADLKGKSIGISYNSIIEYVVDGLLEEAGMKTTDVNKTSVVKIPVRMEMLFNNKIDAISVPDPLATFAEFKGAKIVGDDTKGKNLSQVVVVMRENALQEKRAGVKGFYSAYAKAVDDINTAPEDFKDMLVENINIPEPIIEDYRIAKYPKPQLPTEENINNVLKWMDNKELLENELNYDDLVEKELY